MCLFPKTINKPNPLSGYHFIAVNDVERSRIERLYGFHRIVVNVPCGKCTECLKKRQNDLALRCMREAAKRGSMQFITLTYDEENLPLSCRLVMVDKSTGEIYTDMLQTPLLRVEDSSKEASPEFLSWCRGKLSTLPLSSSARVLTASFFEDDVYLYQYEITPSLNRRDVRLWLKRCRVRYLREKGVKLPEFTYVVCGEYGPKTCRPHYHIALFGLSRSQAEYLRNQWDFGFTDLKTVNATNEDGTNGFEIASRYIGKYMSKGKFECDSVKCGQSEKPRLMLSRGVGTDLPESLLSYFRCEDLFGKYDLETLVLQKTGSVLSDSQLSTLFKEIKKRSFFPFGEHKYAIPRNILLKIWYYYDPCTLSYRSYQVRRLYTASLRSDFFAEFVRKREEGVSRDALSEAFNEAFAFIVCSEDSNLFTETFNEGAFRSFYSKSIF